MCVARPLRSEATITRPAGRVSVTALDPGQQRELHIAATLSRCVVRPCPRRRCGSSPTTAPTTTADVARAHGADVYTTVENRHRKAGGLNQLLARLLPTFGPLDAVLVMDADTVMVDDFLERAAAEFDALPDLDAVGGVFVGDDSPGLLGQLQRNEYLRYGRDISRRQGRVFVLTGTASLFRADALAAVAAARGIRAARRRRRRLRHVLTHRGQRADAGLEDARRPDDLTTRLSGAHRADADLARPVASTATLAARRAREHRHVRDVLGDRPVLDPAVRPRLRRPRPRRPTSRSPCCPTSPSVCSPSSSSGRSSAPSSPSNAPSPCGPAAGEHVCSPCHCSSNSSMRSFLQLVYVKSLLDIALGRSKHWNAATVGAPSP